ncbi:gliding motility-associated protein GldE [Bacteroides intestinalis]|uniref:Gliding motility-associated protein GldE n=2 Tax=Bacteroides intestinalis TaxID=329854 RepID=A0A4Q5HDN9_9BACE|nr:gliding motility-associated protein GldE [Bacteroides intestinalis]KAA4689734.1 gliding motility-associated protein GldE [Bacteroides intestinalis]KAA4721838.1 gliding motility-associated protein GldE [Bacteroides intestinalis]RYT79109.1 gliding motility-associated protein GldE [Bacteroides intestinalis]
MDPDAYLCQLADVFNGISVHSPTISAIIAIVLAGLLLLVSGFASASEIAFFSLSPSDLNAIDEKKHPSDEKISKLLDDTERLLATILITNNFVNVTIIMLCNFFFMSVFEFHSPIAEFLILTVILTFLLLLFGEIMPKIYSAQKTLAFCRFSAPGIWMFRSLFYPVASMLVRSTSFLNKHFARKNHNISVDELSHALELTDKEELKEENNILEGIIRFGGETAKEVMTSRLDVVDLDIRTPFKDVLQCIIENAYSRIPIYSENRDNIKGILYIKDLLPHLNKVDFRWQSLIRPAYFVPETKMIDDLLRDFQANKIHIAIVVDEFGGTSGIVTMEDIIEEIVGEIHDEYDDEERTYAVLNDHTWVFEAKTQLTDFYKITKVDEEVFDEVAGDSDTLAGLLLELKGEFPALHEKVTYDHYEFEVLEMDNRRILKVKFTINTPPSDSDKKD